MDLKAWLRTNALARTARELIAGIKSISDTPIKSVCRELEKFRINTVIDCGANVGQFGLDLRRGGFEGLIVSFEPVQENFRNLSITLQKKQPWKAFHLGLGATESELSINVSGNAGLSSSILEMNPLHLDNFPDSVTIAKQKISVSTVDEQLKILGLLPENVMLKIDVQGYESEVLRGAVNSLSRIPICYLEVSISPLYEGEMTILPILNELSNFGHEVFDVFRGITATDGQLLQLDILTILSNR